MDQGLSGASNLEGKPMELSSNNNNKKTYVGSLGERLEIGIALYDELEPA